MPPPTSVRQFVILSGQPPAPPGTMVPIGSRRELLRGLARLNTAPEREGADDVLYGPGFRIELAPGQDPVVQMLVTITEEEIGWLVLMRLAQQFHWKLLDPMTGREFGAERANSD